MNGLFWHSSVAFVHAHTLVMDYLYIFYMISLLFARVINLIIVIVIVNNIYIVMVRIYNFMENKDIFQ